MLINKRGDSGSQGVYNLDTQLCTCTRITMTKIIPPRFEGTFRLKDGRRLGYAEYGPANGKRRFLRNG